MQYTYTIFTYMYTIYNRRYVRCPHKLIIFFLAALDESQYRGWFFWVYRFDTQVQSSYNVWLIFIFIHMYFFKINIQCLYFKVIFFLEAADKRQWGWFFGGIVWTPVDGLIIFIFTFSSSNCLYLYLYFFSTLIIYFFWGCR